MRGKRIIHSILLSTIIMVILVACGAQPEVVTQAPATPTDIPAVPTETSAPTPTEIPTGLVTNLTDLKKATIQIEGEGTFIDPEYGYLANAAGRGSGFIIDPSGIAVTNNHVVTGAALLKVWVGGDTNKVYNARVLGVSECSDLAVIDIEGDGFFYLPWYEGVADVGLQVYAAGFPLGDPEYTMTNGIVSKAKADGETSWASVDSVIEHTSTINPGNSGGPLVDQNASIVGINYAGSSSTNQYFAIDRGTALPVIEQLRGGNDVESIGINGQAITSDDGSFSGIWVSSIDSGSPADKAGVKAGDIVTSLENLYLATDGTMKDYCDILRTNSPEDTLALEVLRLDTNEVLQGQLNGRTLEVSYNFGSPSPTDITGSPEPTDASETLPANCDTSDTEGFIRCYDDTTTVWVDVPADWLDVNGASWTYEDVEIGWAVSAAPSLDDYNSFYDAEGLFYGASDTWAKVGGYIEFLDFYGDPYLADCTRVGRYNYNDGYYRGKYDLYTNCLDVDDYATYLLSAVDIEDPTAMIILVIATVFTDDTATVEQIWNTFDVNQ